MRRILFATDLSKASAKAFATAMTLTKVNRATMTIVHVVTPLSPLAPELSNRIETVEELDIEMRRWARRQVTKLTEKAKKAGLRAAGVIMEGDPARQIVRAARSKRADLVVLGTHGRTGFTRFFVGSVAGRVVATAPCPVLTVRGK
jgi:nucleotide-binding universal stress UspA family protein